MKTLLLALFLACSATAMANHTDPIQEKRTTTTAAQAAKVAAKAEKHTVETTTKQHVTVKEDNSHHVVADNSRYGIGAYIVEFINRSNIKIMRKILID